jgi:hypothetical protein
MEVANSTDGATIQLPWGREVRVQELEYEGGMRMLRLRIREGKRFTDLEVGPEGARQLVAILNDWVGRHG